MPNLLKKLSFIISILGLLSLILITFLSPPIKLTSKTQLDNLEENQKVILTSKVIKETQTQFSKTLYLENDLRVYSDPDTPTYLSQNVRIIAKAERYNNKNSLQLLKISPQ